MLKILLFFYLNIWEITDKARKMTSSIHILDRYILDEKYSSDSDHELWGGRERQSNEKINAFIFLNSLPQEAISDIKKWVKISSYEEANDKIIRYIEHISSSSSSFKKDIIIYTECKLIPLDTLLKTQLSIYEKINHAHGLIRAFLFIHSMGVFHGQLNSSVVWDYQTRKMKIFKNPKDFLAFISPSLDHIIEYKKCGSILGKIFNLKNNHKEAFTPPLYIRKIIACYSYDKREKLPPPSPKEIYNLFHKGVDDIKENYRTALHNPMLFSLVDFMDFFQKIQIKQRGKTADALFAQIHDIFPLISKDIFNHQNQLFFKILSAIEGNPKPVITQVSSRNVILIHAILKEVEREKSTVIFLNFLMKNVISENIILKLVQLAKTENKESLDSPIDNGTLEEYRRRIQLENDLEKNQEKKILTEVLYKAILASNDAFYDNF